MTISLTSVGGTKMGFRIPIALTKILKIVLYIAAILVPCSDVNPIQLGSRDRRVIFGWKSRFELGYAGFLTKLISENDDFRLKSRTYLLSPFFAIIWLALLSDKHIRTGCSGAKGRKFDP